MRRVILIALALAGGIGFMAAGPISARVPGAVHSFDNNAKTGKYTPPHGLDAAVVAETASCTDATYTRGPIPAVLEALPHIESGSTAFATKRLCIRNTGRAPGQVRFTAFNVAEIETTCEPEEVDPAVGNDTTCTTNADGTTTGAGELGPVLDLSVFPDGTNPAGCGGGQILPFSAVRSAPGSPTLWRTLSPSLAVGDTCRYTWNAQMNGSTTEAQRFVAQTDEVRFSFQFNLEDIPA